MYTLLGITDANSQDQPAKIINKDNHNTEYR